MKKIVYILALLTFYIHADWYMCVTNPTKNFSDAQFLRDKQFKPLFKAANSNDALKECTQRANKKNIREFAVYKNKKYGPLIQSVVLKHEVLGEFEKSLKLSAQDKEELDYYRGNTYASKIKLKKK